MSNLKSFFNLFLPTSQKTKDYWSHFMDEQVRQWGISDANVHTASVAPPSFTAGECAWPCFGVCILPIHTAQTVWRLTVCGPLGHTEMKHRVYGQLIWEDRLIVTILNVKQTVMSAINEGTNQVFERKISCTHYSCVGICALKVKVLVTQSRLSLCSPMNCSPPGSSVHGILQARIVEYVAIPFSRGSSQPGDQTQVSCIAGRVFTVWDTLVHVIWPPSPLHDFKVRHLHDYCWVTYSMIFHFHWHLEGDHVKGH